MQAMSGSIADYKANLYRQKHGLVPLSIPETSIQSLPQPAPPVMVRPQVTMPSDSTPFPTPTLEYIHRKHRQPDKPKAWKAPYFDDLRTFEAEVPNILDSLSSEDPLIQYRTKKALQNFRNFIENIGNLYLNYSIAN